jgi:molecular chaperone DnaK
VETAIADLRGVMDSGDASSIQSKTEALAQASMKIGEQLYKSQQEANAAGAAGAAQPEAEPGVVDAEFSEVKDDKKNGTA